MAISKSIIKQNGLATNYHKISNISLFQLNLPGLPFKIAIFDIDCTFSIVFCKLTASCFNI